MNPIMFDTSVYISSLRSGDEAILRMRNVEFGSPLWLSAVVLEELYAGANSTGRKNITRIERDFDKAERLLVPNLNDWTKTGNILAEISGKYGHEHIGRARLTNDALIATSASRIGLTVLTLNQRDFARIVEFCPLKWSRW